MPYALLEHTADVRMKVSGATLEEIFADALAGMMAILKPEIAAGAQAMRRIVALDAPDETALLVDFLNEGLSLSFIHKEAYQRVIFKKLSAYSLEAELEGVPVTSFEGDIKAVTYHEAGLKKNAAGLWETMLVFDI